MIPPGFRANVTIQAWGAGGGGGTNTSGAKGGGGSGAFASSTITLSAGSYAVTIGIEGAAGNAGGSSSFTSIVVAAGGGSTSSATGGAGATAAASTGITSIAGSDGDTGPGNSDGNGAAGSNGGGTGGSGGPTNNGSGNEGNLPGGGGGGKAGPGGGGLSGAGGNGRVIVTVNTVLPVKISNIKAVEKQNNIQLEWIAYAESNLDRYQVVEGGNIIIGDGIIEEASMQQGNFLYVPIKVKCSVNLTFEQLSYIKKCLRGQDGTNDYGYFTITNPCGEVEQIYPTLIDYSPVEDEATIEGYLRTI